MKTNILALMLAFALFFIPTLSAAAETREGVIYLEGAEEIIEETLLESGDGFSFWYANEQLEAYEGEADGYAGAVVVNPWSNDYMILSSISEDEAKELMEIYGVSFPEGSYEAPAQIELYCELEDWHYSFCVLIAENGRYVRAAGQYSQEAAEGTAKYFQLALDSVAFTNAGRE